MTIQRKGTNEVDKIYRKGTTLIDRVYRGDRQVYQLPALPTITSFTANPTHFRSEDLPTTRTLTLTFAVTGSTQNRIHVGTTNVPLTTSTTAIIPMPTTDTRYVLSSSNVHGTVYSHLDFIVTTDISVALARQGNVLQQPVPLSTLINQYQSLSFSASGHPFPRLSITGFPRINLNLDWDRRIRTIRAFRQIQPNDPAVSITYTLTGTNGYSSSSASVSVHYPGYPT